MSVDLNGLISLILRLDVVLQLNDRDHLVYHQSRFWLFRHLHQNGNKSNADRREPIRGIVFDFVCFCVGLLRILFYRIRRRVPVLIIEHTRYRGYQWGHGDPYFGITENTLARRDDLIVVIGLNDGSPLTRIVRGKNVIVLPRGTVNLLRYVAGKIFRGDRHKALVSQVASFLDLCNLSRLLSEKTYLARLRQAEADNWFYGWIIRAIRPKSLLCVDGYNSNSSFILNANARGIPTVEYQHGIISDGHLGYNFNPDYVFPEDVVPKHIVLWGRFWERNLSPTLVKHLDVRIGTYEYGQWWRQRVRRDQKAKGVLFIMQPSAASFIIEQVRHFKKQFPGEIVGVRYHPKQREKISGLEDVEHHWHENIYDLFLKYQYVIGCFSTALFEAVAMQRRVFYMPFSGFDAYEKMMRSVGINPLSTFDDLYVAKESVTTSQDIMSDVSNLVILEDLLCRP